MQASAPVPGGNSTRFGHGDLARLAPRSCQTPQTNARCSRLDDANVVAQLQVSIWDTIEALQGIADPVSPYYDPSFLGKAAYAPVDLPSPSGHLGTGRTGVQDTTLAKDPGYTTMSAAS